MDSVAFELAASLAAAAPRASGAPESLLVANLTPNTTYWFALKAIDDYGNPGALSPSVPVTTPGPPSAGVAPGPIAFAFRVISANPSPRGAVFALTLPRPGDADVAVYDVRGARVRTLSRGAHVAGVHELRWDGADERGSRAGAGVYYVQARGNAGVATRRVVVLGN
jgi:hypothetical protein